MKTRRRVAACLIALGVVAACIPVLLAWYLARQQAQREKFLALESMATSIGLHINQSHNYLGGLIRTMRGRADPCSPEGVAQMQRFQLDSYGVKSALVIRDRRILCSSSGVLLNGLELGEPDIRQPSGSELYFGLSLPGVRGWNFTVLDRDGFGVLMYPAGVIAPYAQKDMAVGIFAGTSEHAVKYGPLHERWTVPLAPGVSADQIIDTDTGYFVVRHRPVAGVSTVFVAVPLAEVAAREAQLRNQFLPLGILAGLLLLGGCYLLSQHNLSPRTRVLDMIRRNQLFLVYQPVVDLQDNNACIGAEALVRWREADGTVLGPATFIDFAEKAGLIHLVTERVLRLVAQDLAGFLRANPEFRIGVNVAPSDLQSPLTTAALSEVIEQVGKGNGRFLIEVTERGLLDQDAGRQAMQSISAMGVDIAIDDFGTGYSSLAYLTSYPFTLLKIDRTFVAAACTDAVNSKIASHIIELGRTARMEVLAEGIETEQEAALFRAQGADFGQGYYFARPMPAEELVRYYQAHRPGQTPA